jgi:hypothetical protein
MRQLVFLVLLFAMGKVQALSLFGIEPLNAGRNELRAAVFSSGATNAPDAAASPLYETYEAGQLLPGALRLYLGFEPDTNAWAFAEYEFAGPTQPMILGILRAKYGDPEKTPARFVSDRAFHWRVDGVSISLYQDWPLQRTRLLFQVPERLSRMRAAHAGSGALSRPEQANNL